MVMIEKCRADYWNKKGETMIVQGRFEEAADCFNKSLTEDPDSFKAKVNLDYVEELMVERDSILFPHGDIDRFRIRKVQ
jgi:hypothetical protein